MADAPEPLRLRRDLRAMMGDGLAFSVMVGSGEAYLPAFALALGLGDVTAGLIATLPMLAGALLQLVSPAAVAALGSHRRWVVTCAALQAASFVPLVTGALAGSFSTGWLFFTASLYWGFGMATGPAWNTWVGTLVPGRLRATFFAARARWSQLAVVFGLGAGGLLLQYGSEREQPVRIFAIVFGLALLARGCSAWYLSRQSEPQPVPLGDTRISPAAILEHARTGGHGRLLAYLLAFQLAVWIAAPFFTPYMLGPLGLSYLQFTVLTGTAFVARVLALPTLGRLAHRAGTRKLLWLGSLGIVPLPALWLVSSDFVWLLGLQLASGAVWAAFELATLLSFFEHIPPHRRTSVLSIYNLANALAIVGGSLLGGLLLDRLAHSPEAYAVLLLSSTAVRLLALSLLRGMPDRIPSATTPPLRTIAIRPSSGGLQRPVLPALPDDD